MRTHHHSSRGLGLTIAIAGTLFFAGCSGDDGDAGPPGPPGGGGLTPTQLDPQEDAPGLNVTIVSLGGGSLDSDEFAVGDTLSVTFTLTKDDGSSWDIVEMNTARMIVSGPTFNYQRVLPQVTDLATASVLNADGSYTYTFADPIPAVYAPPLNDSAAFGVDDGELSGLPLLAGTYTLAGYFAWNYTVEGDSFRDVGNVDVDFLLGGATVLAKREVVAQANCNRCHQELQAHGGSRQNLTLCLLCHTSGAEDRDNPAIGGGTPGVTIDFRVMIHRIHNGKHLPSVLGVSTDASGDRIYDPVAAKPYLVAAGSAHDYSNVAFPAWPSGLIAMPRDQGYTALSATAKAMEDTIRTGVVDCAVCHGDPDGAGPIAAPAQGDLYKSQPSRNACGSCHDDIHWGSPYTANGQTMTVQATNSDCLLCHETSGTPLATQDAHIHPLKDPAFNAGTNFDLLAAVEAGAHNADDTLDPGEKLSVQFEVMDDSGVALAPAALGTSITGVVSGPTSNMNLLLNASIPTAALTGPPPFTVNLPENVILEFAGDATGVLGDQFVTARAPHWDVAGGATSVLVRTATAGGSSTLSAAATPPQNYVDVVDAAGFVRNDYIVLDDSVVGLEEYLRIQFVDGTRLWFSSPASSGYQANVRVAHAAGATVREITATSKVEGIVDGGGDYLLDPLTGTITEVTEFGAGNAVLVSYTADWVMPGAYPLALNGSPDLDATWGKWTGEALVDGTYSVGLWGSQALALVLYGESNSYRSTAEASMADFLVGSAATQEPYALISSGQNCSACHQDVLFHGGGRRGFDACVLCHGASGGEDRPPYIAGNAPATTGADISFRVMLHKIHMGEALTNASAYTLVGFGAAAWPNNFTPHTYEEVVFPAMPSEAKDCAVCHGSSNTAWYEPADRLHPDLLVPPTQSWRAVCGACHDSSSTGAHIDAQTASSGFESCAVCHGEGKPWEVPLVHKVR